MKPDNTESEMAVDQAERPTGNTDAAPTETQTVTRRFGRRARLISACILILAALASAGYASNLNGGSDMFLSGGGRGGTMQSNPYFESQIATFGGAEGARFADGLRGSREGRQRNVTLWKVISWGLGLAGVAMLISGLRCKNSKSVRD